MVDAIRNFVRALARFDGAIVELNQVARRELRSVGILFIIVFIGGLGLASLPDYGSSQPATNRVELERAADTAFDPTTGFLVVERRYLGVELLEPVPTSQRRGGLFDETPSVRPTLLASSEQRGLLAKLDLDKSGCVLNLTVFGCRNKP